MENIFKKEEETVFNLTDEIRPYLQETARWCRFLAIMGFICMGLVVLGVAAFLLFGIYSKLPGNSMGMIGMAVVYVVVAVIYLFPTLYLFQFSSKIKHWLLTKDENAFVTGFANLKSFFRFIGILTIIAICFYGLMLLVMIPTMMVLFNR